MRTVIANNCLSIHLYRKQNREYDNPFFGNRIFCKDFQKLMENYETINYKNVDMCLNDSLKHTDPVGMGNHTVSIILNGNIRIFYPHFQYSSKDKVPRKVGGNVYYYKNFELLFIFSDNEVPGFSTVQDRINLIKAAETCKKKLLFITEKEKYKQYENAFCKVLIIKGYDFGKVMTMFWDDLQ